MNIYEVTLTRYSGNKIEMVLAETITECVDKINSVHEDKNYIIEKVDLKYKNIIC